MRVQVFFEECNHWLYLEEPAKFNSLLADFAKAGFVGVNMVLRV